MQLIQKVGLHFIIVSSAGDMQLQGCYLWGELRINSSLDFLQYWSLNLTEIKSVVQWINHRGGDPNAEDKDSYTPVKYALETDLNDSELIALLTDSRRW